MDEQTTVPTEHPVSRRALAAGAVWSLPAVATLGAAPAVAASSFGRFYAAAPVISTGAGWVNPTNALGVVNASVATWTGNQNDPRTPLVLGNFTTGTVATLETLRVEITLRASDPTKINSATVAISAAGGALTATPQTVTSITTSLVTYVLNFTLSGWTSVNLATIRVSVAAGPNIAGGNSSLSVDAVAIQHIH